MNNTKKIIVIILVFFGVIMLTQTVFGDYLDPHKSLNQFYENNNTAANNAIRRIWGVIILALQMLSVAAVIITGIRYMFASSEGKADIKNQSFGFIVGAILVFAASTVVGFIVDVTEEVVKL